ncbi:unnamed protein product [Urochloa decumbens]|uniref:SKP1-like protein n=1 Tax=Urochloa decumbens TaxID=240449 RepID=A0ABC9EAV2_9POAL
MAAADSGVGSSSSGGGRGGEEKTVTLVSSDGARFEVREAAASLSQTLRRMINVAGAGGSAAGIPLPDIDAMTLSMVLEYCNKHAPSPAADADAESSSAEAAAGEQDVKWFDREFLQVDRETLFSLIRAAHYLKVQSLLDLTCKTVADMIKGMTAEEIGQTLGIRNDLMMPEEEEAIHLDHAWAFE